MRLGLFALLFATWPLQAEELKALVDAQIERLTKDKPSTAGMVAIQIGQEVHYFPFGKVKGESPNPSSIFEIGSITKVFAGILLADRVVAGVVKLDDPIQKHLPAGWMMPRRDDREITLVQLATHTSGIARLPDGFLAYVLREPKNPYAKYTVKELAVALPKTKINNAIGAKHEYSNLGVGLLGHALAHASKSESFEQVLADRILKPLGMSDTTMTLSEAQKKRLISGHNEKGDDVGNWEFGCMEACGGLKSTPQDMLKLVKANLEPPGQLKKPIELAQQCWREIIPGQSEIGLGWMRRPKKEAGFFVWHNGETGGYHSFCAVMPGKGGVVVLCNTATNKVDELGSAIMKFIAEKK